MNARIPAIMELVQREPRVTVRDLAARFSVSEMTIRRDLAFLEEQNYLVRTYGGGVAVNSLRFLQSAFPEYSPSPEKLAIGKLAAGLVQPGQTIMVDSGTTTLEVARHLPQNSDITVVTTSLCVAQELYGAKCRILLIGGFLRDDFPSSYGPMTESILDNLRVDTLFIGCDGADSRDGFYTSDLLVSSLERKMIGISTRVIVVTESSKFRQRALVRFATPEQVDTVITDSGLVERDRGNLEGKGISIIIAGDEKHE